jgi:hypothetical protein
MHLTKIQDQAIQARIALIVGAKTFDDLFAGNGLVSLAHNSVSGGWDDGFAGFGILGTAAAGLCPAIFATATRN